MRPLRIRALLATATGFAALPIVGPLMSVIRDEWDAALTRGDSLEREADAANARVDAANKIIGAHEEASAKYVEAASESIGALKRRLAEAATDRDSLAVCNVSLRAEAAKAQALHAASSKLVAAQMAEAKVSIDDACVAIRSLQNDLAVVSGERDVARKERDELALRLAVETEHRSAMLLAASLGPCGISMVDAGPDPVRDWPQSGVDHENACDACGKDKRDDKEDEAESEGLCYTCFSDVPWIDLVDRVNAHRALKSAAAPKSST